MRERLSLSCGRVVSEIGERGRDRDDRQATRSAAVTTPPSYTNPLSSGVFPGSTGPVDREGEVVAVMMWLYVFKLQLAFESKRP